MKRWIFAILACALFCCAAAAQAQVVWQDDERQVEVVSVMIDGEEWLFLPSGADLSAMSLRVNGEPFSTDWKAAAQTDEEIPGVYSGVLEPTGEILHVAVSQNLRSLHLQSSDPVQYGREWLEDCSLHQKETTGRIVILNEEGRVDLQQGLYQLRGRGNSTWRNSVNKRPYQFKLEYAADVLKTGLAHEYATTWVLLSNEQDNSGTMLRNQLALDLAREMGMSETSRCEQVDLYYDGDYRGTYLLAEKVEVGERGVDILDFDGLLEPVNLLAGNPIPDELPSPSNYGTEKPVPKGKTASGAQYGHSEGVYDNRDVAGGGYLLELDHYGTLSEQAWFQLPTGYYISFKNPEYAGAQMVNYVAEKFLNAYRAMMNYGFHPETDEPLETFIDVDSFVRSHLVSELLYNSNAYYFSSTFFVLPERGDRFYAGPVWDFDHHVGDDWPALKDNNPFSRAFYRTTVFQRAAKRMMTDVVANIYDHVLLGSENGSELKPFSWYREELRQSWYMNFYRFEASANTIRTVESGFERAMNGMESFLQQQYDFLAEEIAAWGEDETTDALEVECILPYAEQNPASFVHVLDEPHGSLFLENADCKVVEEASEDSGAVWELTLTFRPKPHCELAEAITVAVNGEDFDAEIRDGEAVLVLRYEDPSYRPAVLDGVDYGYVFNYEYYLDNYPELMDEYGEDYEEILRHFRDDGMEMGDVANEFFDPMAVFEQITSAAQQYEADWQLYYHAFMQTPGIWMAEMEMTYEPEFWQP